MASPPPSPSSNSNSSSKTNNNGTTMKQPTQFKLLILLLSIIVSSSFLTPPHHSTTTLSFPTPPTSATDSNSNTRLEAKKSKKKKSKSNSPIISTNRQARRNYEVVSTYNAGVSLLGSEIKAIRDGKMNLRDGFVRPDKTGRGVSLHNVHIGKHATAEYFNHEERRVRPLLLRKEECRKLRREVEIKGMTIVPLKAFYNDNNMVKIEIGLCRGKNVRDKRNAIKDREAKRDADRMVKNFRLN